MYKWSLPTLSEVLTLSEPNLANGHSQKVNGTATQNYGGNVTAPPCSRNQNAVERIKAEGQWSSAIAALEQLVLQSIDTDILGVDKHLPPTQGLIFAGPVPILSHPLLVSSLPTWIFTAEALKPKALAPFQLPPAKTIPVTNSSSSTELVTNTGSVLPLLPDDPLSKEQFCLVLTARFSLVMVLGEDVDGVPAFLFSFEPEVVEQAWRSLRARVKLTTPHFPLSQLDCLVEQYYPVAPDYRTVTQFSRLLLKCLPDLAQQDTQKPEVKTQEPKVTSQPSLPPGSWLLAPSSSPDVELLQAFAHEVRTPLTTIRTLTRLLLKHRDLATEVIKRLEIIDHECTEQINRMELLFRAAELEISAAKNTNTHLTAMSLDQVLQQSIPRWQKQASRRNLTLEVVLPQYLPTVVSDPIMLDQVLTGLIENFTRSLPAGSHIQVQVMPTGDQLKLQLLTESKSEESGKVLERCAFLSTRKSLGQLLMFQPETGNISLNLTATKHLFQAIGGKLIVRQRPHKGEVLTIFLPLDVSHREFYRRGQGTVNQSAG